MVQKVWIFSCFKFLAFYINKLQAKFFYSPQVISCKDFFY